MNMSYILKLQDFITDEMQDYDFYTQLASLAPDAEQKAIITGMAKDELSHAESFQKIYKQMTGTCYAPHLCAVTLDGTYDEILVSRVFNETRDYEKYRSEMLKTSYKSEFWTACYCAGTDEACHADKLLALVDM